ncbi:CTLH/CRA C-terminal to lish motif domain-containing protein [Mycena rebaudengoi]|nr:CTLH/CRA C-terminal to lish motif domain-containing protein [Mycena rebaudengoi]
MSSATEPYQLRALVLDYLCHNGYSSTARAFAQSSAVPRLDADGDEIMHPAETADYPAPRVSEETLAQVDLRQSVRTHILAGRISAATELLEKHFPAVLSADAPAPKPHKSLTGTDFVASTTLDPTHLTLNLRILAFTEAFRTTPDPLENPITESSDGDDPRATVLLSKARKLYAQVHMLANPIEREAYTTELRNVAGLLAYPDPLSSPVAKYLSQERREAVANQINTAILYRTGFPAISHLELSTRYTSTLWSFLHDFRVKPRPGVPLPPTDKDLNPQVKGMKTADIDVPRFDLQQFLNSRA